MVQWISLYCHLLVSQQFNGRYSSYLRTSFISQLHLHTQNTISNRKCLCPFTMKPRCKVRTQRCPETGKDKKFRVTAKCKPNFPCSERRKDDLAEAVSWAKRSFCPIRLKLWRKSRSLLLPYSKLSTATHGFRSHSWQSQSFSLDTSTTLISDSTTKLHWMRPQRLYATCSRNTLICGGGTVTLILSWTAQKSHCSPDQVWEAHLCTNWPLTRVQSISLPLNPWA